MRRYYPYRFGPVAVVLLTSVLPSGCGDAGRVTVGGAVTLDGSPVPGVTITFLPTKETAAPAAGGIVGKNGTYEVAFTGAPSTGTYRVEIRGLERKTGKMIPAPPPFNPGALIEESFEAIPDRYNKQSTLTVELKRGDNRRDFVLTTKE